MSQIWSFIKDSFSIGGLPSFRISYVVEILIIAIAIYQIMRWIKDTRAWMLFKGIVTISAFVLLAYIFRLTTILWIFSRAITIVITGVLIVFQPELRRALEQLGRKNYISNFFSFGSNSVDSEQSARNIEKCANEVIKACFEMEKTKTGALIVMEKEVGLSEYEKTGIFLDSLVSSQLLINIFEHNTPLHDGAVFIRNSRIVAATCYLPLSDNMELSKDLGTRHRAGVGISEVSDSITIIVSEETGMVSVAEGGKLVRGVDAEFLKAKLATLKKREGNEKKLKKLRGRAKNEKMADQ